MQAAKNAAASVKETAANVAASAKAGMDKTKATMQEKVEKMSAHDPVEKDMAAQRKEEKIEQAELNKLEAREHNAASKQAAAAGGTQSYTTGVTGAAHQTPATTGGAALAAAHQTPSIHLTAAGQTGHVTEGVVGSQQYPVGANTGTGRTPVQDTNTNVGGGGGAYS
ncbi:11 kDa late embryogenesis abundant protein-like [Cornus florida]|uniref:11 kDa late embryogenesis abundant protein-like n=1 Tax=Cornus florida TaxID=4283 RepID=UPI00289F9BA0|nr:11 kDa late embryogenesis abundant protein-like [Cornus florida]